MNAKQIVVRHEVVKPAVGQTWHANDRTVEVIKLYKGGGSTKMITVADLGHPKARKTTMTLSGFLNRFPSAEVWLPKPKARKLQWQATLKLTHESFGGHTHNDGIVTMMVYANTLQDALAAVYAKARKEYPGSTVSITSLKEAKRVRRAVA